MRSVLYTLKIFNLENITHTPPAPHQANTAAQIVSAVVAIVLFHGKIMTGKKTKKIL